MAASYPTSIKSFTTKVDNVDDVVAAHVNDLQLEVVALETACGIGKSTSAIQVKNTQTGAVATGTTTVPFDDTIPQNTEGDQYMTLAITPKATTNVLVIDVVAFLSSDTAGTTHWTLGLFQDSTAGALACTMTAEISDSTMQKVFLRHYMVAGTTSATTFKVRAGSQTASTTTFNGVGGARKGGGVLASSITITEYLV